MPTTPESPRDRFMRVVQGLPLAHRVAIGASLAVLVLAGLLFVRWISKPSYSVLASGVSDVELAQVTNELDTLGVGYKIEAGGSRIMVPRSDLSTARAGLASAGLSLSPESSGPQGYELLDNQGLAISTSLEKINFQRALEGELARTLRSMDRVQEASVHLVIPDRNLFGDSGTASASVVIDVPDDFTLAETDAVANLVAGSVDNLSPSDVTVIDLQGRTLQAPEGASDSVGGLGGRNVLQTLDYEQRIESDITRLLLTAGAGDRSTVMVRAQLNFDEVNEQTQNYDETSQVPVRQQTTKETFTGAASAAPGGVAGVDGGNTTTGGDNQIDYSKEESVTEYGVDLVTSSVTRAPGDVEALHVGIVIDDGSLTGADVPSPEEVKNLVSASVGINPDRGDTLVVTAVPFPVVEDTGDAPTLAAGAGATATNPLDLLPQAAGALILLIVSVTLILMSRRKNDDDEDDDDETPALQGSPAAPALPGGTTPDAAGGEAGVRTEVLDLVQRQPEEIASLLRGWLAGR